MSPFPRRDKVNIQIPDEIVEEFRVRARDTGDSVNRLIEQALREWLDQHRYNSASQTTRRNEWR